MVEYATKFSQVVSERLLWEKEDQIYRLFDLITFGFLMDFDEDVVTYFLTLKNLHIFPEDKELLSSLSFLLANGRSAFSKLWLF